MNALFRPLSVAVCSLFVLLSAAEASSQVLPQQIIQAERFDATAREAMANMVGPAMDLLIDGTPAEVSEARETLIAPLKNESASVAFRDTFSAMITGRMDRAVTSESELVRINAMIVLTRMTDQGSMAHINAGLEDDSPAVQRWAMKALGQRIAWWQSLGNKQAEVRAGIQTISAKLNQQGAPPHPIVVGPALEILFTINTPESRAALIEQLNNRVALHAADPNLSYAPERAAVASFANAMALATTPDTASSAGLARAAHRYSILILSQIKAGSISSSNNASAVGMLSQCVLAHGQVAAGIRKQLPANQAAAINDWIPARRWDDIQALLVDQWVPILGQAPLNLTAENLAVE